MTHCWYFDGFAFEFRVNRWMIIKLISMKIGLLMIDSSTGQRKPIVVIYSGRVIANLHLKWRKYYTFHFLTPLFFRSFLFFLFFRTFSVFFLNYTTYFFSVVIVTFLCVGCHLYGTKMKMNATLHTLVPNIFHLPN